MLSFSYLSSLRGILITSGCCALRVISLSEPTAAPLARHNSKQQPRCKDKQRVNLVISRAFQAGRTQRPTRHAIQVMYLAIGSRIRGWWSRRNNSSWTHRRQSCRDEDRASYYPAVGESTALRVASRRRQIHPPAESGGLSLALL